MKRILIVENSKLLTVSLVDAMRGKYEIHTCTQGDIALMYLERLRPDALIINLGAGGLAVLEHTSYTPPVILALTDYASSEDLQHAANLGVKQIYYLPCSAKAVASRLQEMLETVPI